MLMQDQVEWMEINDLSCKIATKDHKATLTWLCDNGKNLLSVFI